MQAKCRRLAADFSRRLTAPKNLKVHPVAPPAALLLLIVLFAALAPVLTAADPMATNSPEANESPSAEHLFGTDQFGRDVWSRTLWGGRRTLAVALLGTAVSLLPGLLIGLVAGYGGGALDRVLMGAVDALLAFPNLLLAMALVALLGYGPYQIALAVGLAGFPACARVTRAAALEARSALYVEAARAVGAKRGRILLRHILPNIAATLLAFGAVSFSWSLLHAAALNFLGLGGAISAPDWGVMLADARQAFRVAPWAGAAPGLAITLTVLAANALAEGWQRATRVGGGK